ncbi:MAG: efflux RND transporter permease subunit [Thermodesulfobacteriota bacterium]
MDIVSFAIRRPVAVIVGVILIVLFGVLGLRAMPYQLSPEVTEPEITVTTVWLGATPYEIEREIVEEQEKVLKGIPGLVDMESSSFNNQGSITLRFEIGTSVDDALLRVSNKINEVHSYPVNVEKPVINATGAATSPVIWMILKTRPGNTASASTYRTFFENEVRQHLERVEGVADLFIAGGTEREMHIVVDPDALAAYGLTVEGLMRTVSAENVNISAGTMGVDRRDYRIRTVGEFDSPGDIERIVVKSTGRERVLLSDVASVSFGYRKADVAMIHNGREGIAIGIKPQSGTNILDMTGRVERVVTRLNDGKLKAKDIYLDWVYDQRPYIDGAIDLVRRNILIGGVLAVVVLFVFLGSVSATVVVATAIPISILGSFIVMNALGRNLNVISLAGISFAVGMLVDNAIVVLENIDRHKKLGKSAFDAAYEGAKEVWGAVLASTVTTVAVFLPVVFIREEAGQLFRDIAIAITTSVTLSLVVSVLVIPMLSKQLYTLAGEAKGAAGRNAIARTGARLVECIMALVRFSIRSTGTRVATVAVLTGFAVLSVVSLFPKMEYLPQGNRNLLISILVPPPGLSYKEREAIGGQLFSMAKPYIGKESYQGVPGIKNMFYVGSGQIMLFGAISSQEQNARALLPVFSRFIFSIPGMFGISTQAGIFQTNLGRGRTIDVDISGEDINKTVQVGGMMFGMLKQRIPGAQIRPIPSLELLYPEVRIIPERGRLKAAGMSARELGVSLDVLMDGRKIGDFKQTGQKKIDLVMMASGARIETPEELYEAPVVTSGGRTVPVSSLSGLVRTYGIPQIRHLERRRTVTLQITPPVEMPLQEAMELISDGIIPELGAKGMLTGTEIGLSGAADKLTETRLALQWNFVLAAVITYLLMSALFGNFIYPLIIMFTVPLAASGGFIGLKLVNLLLTAQPLDVLTMLGFVILIGVVVNNAILIIHQTLNNIRLHGMEHREAVLESTRTRLRPIYMSATTSIFGMLPLVVAPGPGSELYRGLGSVVLGGLAVSTIFTVFIIPALLLFVVRMEKVGKKQGEGRD